jgi:hypothetical protein
MFWLCGKIACLTKDEFEMEEGQKKYLELENKILNEQLSDCADILFEIEETGECPLCQRETNTPHKRDCKIRRALLDYKGISGIVF